MNKENLRLYLVTGRYHYAQSEFLQIVEAACQNGVTMVQLREKELSTKAYYELALAVKNVTDRYHIPLIIDDQIDVCLAVDAAGVHIGDADLPVDVARKILGPDKILGVSAKSVSRGKTAAAQGADYLGVGAIFPTQTKVVTRPTSRATLEAIATAVDIPVVAIGGIKEENMDLLKETHIAGVAVVSEIMLADNPGEKAGILRGRLESWHH